MKVCHLTTVHPLYDTRIFYKQCKSLSLHEYSVYLVAQSEKSDVIDGISVISLPKPKNRLVRAIFSTFHAYRLAKKIDASIYHFHDIELLFVGLILRLNGKHVIYDIHEDMPTVILSLGYHYLPSPLKYFFSRAFAVLEFVMCRFFSACVAATPTIGQRIQQYNKKTIIVNNYPITKPYTVALSYHERSNAIGYVGSISVERGLYEMIQSMNHMPDKFHATLHLVGTIPEQLRQHAVQISGWKYVCEHGYLRQNEALDAINTWRIGLVVLHPEPNFIVAQATKLYEYMHAGIPVIASDFPLWRALIERHQCGLVVDPLDPRAIAEAICWLLEHPAEAEAMGQRGRHAIETEYNWAIEAQKLLALYDELAAAPVR
jgi:glycosyltransferase involved in cell wall biosynthesis